MKRTVIALSVLCTMTAVALPAQTFTTLLSFRGTNGDSPYAALVRATDGKLYGTTAYGGANNGGTVFKITESGLRTLYNFCAQGVFPTCADGAAPWALVQAADGDFYGTTEYGGPNGDGTVFKITPSGTLTTLYNFCSQSGCTDGAYPYAGLVQGADGGLYGTTYVGGANDKCADSLPPGCGTVFRITPSGVLTTMYSFCAHAGCSDGAFSSAALVQATNGDVYGITHEGGAYYRGTVFKITPTGALTTLYSFCSQAGCADGAFPYAGLVQATNGNFYGTTEEGGINCGFPSGCGTVFEITPSGTLTTLYKFSESEGNGPQAGLIQGTDGNLYGTTFNGGSNGAGAIFMITPSGTLTTLYSFCAQGECPKNGSNPFAGLVQATNGNLYGTTTESGAHDYGTVFRLSVGLGPFLETQPASGKVGAAVEILGTNLTGATSVTFNGTAAAFTVVRPSEITTTVPTGATTGPVQVVTPSGTLSSNVPFRVKP